MLKHNTIGNQVIPSDLLEVFVFKVAWILLLALSKRKLGEIMVWQMGTT